MLKLLLCLTALLSPSAFAQSNLLPFLVFSKGQIVSQQSDYQGHTGAIGAIDLLDYEIVGDLESAASIRLQRGSVRGTLKAPSASLIRATGKRGKYTPATRSVLESAAYELDSLASKLSALSPTGQVEFGSSVIRGVNVTGLKLTASRPLEVIDVDAATFNQAKNIIVDGSGLLLVRVRGSQVSFSGKGTHIGSSLRPEQVVFFFPEARTLELSYSGGASDANTGTHLGIPGSVVAPYANVHFAEILVTGKLYAGQICTNEGLNGGQVNFGESILLKQLSGCAARVRCQ